MSATASAELLERARALIPATTQTLSKTPSQWVQGVHPNYVRRAQGAHVWDVDGRRWLDFPMGLGPVILGHADPGVNAAIAAQLADGIVYTLPHPIEVEVAERMIERIPGERVRFGKSGSDVDTAAVRLARAFTGREHVVACGYHGWHDWYIATTTRDLGVPRADHGLIDTFAFNDLASLDAALARQAGDTACIVLEPAGAQEPEPGFLEGVAQRARAAGAVLVFDEVITGFRLAPGGAQERYGVTADLATYGKALGNGMPISALAGRAEVMDLLSEVFFSGTHGGEALSLAAAAAVLDRMDADAHAELREKGEWLRERIEQAIDSTGVGDWVTIGGASERTVVGVREPGDPVDGLLAKSVFQQEMARHGVLFNGNNFMSLAHDEADLAQAAEAYAAACAALADGLRADDLRARLVAEPLRPAFRPV